ncbi:sulfatase-like hydrolase/transferase [Neptunicoccus cionae]|uniref:sulfatase-like hydrolase/transferase n=1 Tax=Neptunicoccus cionae TaxID=2035344 RepID=UPI000C76B40C|nr:sulfatase-like hydrolase/transferase [Amylibacter cionae]PLS21061.1 phosphonate monoester hydrolase [Amylibacter cionae]
MASNRNILFIMCDQLRWDYLSCAGHKTLHTPNIDALAARGVRFENAYVQSPICGPSRMSTYTGKYMSSHGATANFVPLRVGQRNIGDHLKPLGVRPVLVGKTHMKADTEGMQRLGVDPDSMIGVHHREIGFEPFERDDGIFPDKIVEKIGQPKYHDYLRKKGYEGGNPWHWAANSVETRDGMRSGFYNDIADQPAAVAEEDSETPYMTRRAMEFMAQDDGGAPWLLHLSYIKPHWPYIAPAPYNSMYSAEDVQETVRSEAELKDTNPLMKKFMDRIAGETFRRDEAIRKIIPTYMGLIKQIDDQLGVLFEFMKERGLLETTTIVLTADHGDYLGDHWMGDKDYFHDPSVKVPLIIADPSPEMDATRGSVSQALVQSIDLLPTFIEHFGAVPPAHHLDGTSLRPLMTGEAQTVNDFVISEYDYHQQNFAPETKRGPRDCRIYMVVTEDWKYIHAPGFEPVLFNRKTDPQEFTDLGRSAAHAEVRAKLHGILADWALQYRQRETYDDETAARFTAFEEKAGVLIGYWDEDDLIDPANAMDQSKQPKL